MSLDHVCREELTIVEEPAFTRSRAERRLVALLRAAQLPEPIFNAVAEGKEVDALWPRERLVLEFGSYAFHATRAAFERDRRKTAHLTRRRYLVLRTTWAELTQQSLALIARVARAQRRRADRVVSSRRPLTPSLRKTLLAWVRTVSTLTDSTSAISLLLHPS